ncbi:MAG: exodeoxyribonuclease VII small subunit [Candidatus Sumerlaeia bacterium]|nr:exodeoxyribonuclease VII small subunit [Candidatus Sumerlaeia bacterium]
MTSTKKKSADESGREATLEKSLERLEKIVEQLESGETDLEKSIDLYLEGKKIGEGALKRLDALERKIQVVVGDEGDELEVEDFQ